MARQMGNSGRGPDDLDRALEGALGDSDMESGDDSGYGSFASGQGGDRGGAFAADEFDGNDTERMLADGELVGEWSDEEDEGGLLAGDETVGPWSDKELDSGNRGDQEQGETDEQGPAGETGPRSSRR